MLAANQRQTTMANHIVTALLILSSMGFTVIGNLVLKTGASRQGFGTTWPLSAVNAHIVLAAVAFGLAFLFYAILLRRLPLSLAQAIMSVQFVLVILAANLVLNESIGAMRWLGIGLMAVGLLIVSASPEAAEPRPSTTIDSR